MTNSTDNPKQKTCVARRHIKPAAFKTYDSMLGTAKAGQAMRVREGKLPGALVYKGSLADLGNKNDRSKAQEGESILELEAEGWIIALQERNSDGTKKQRRNNRAGTWTTCEYRVVEHDEYAQTHDCPPPRYDEKGNLIKAGTLAPGLRRANVRKLLPGLFANDELGDKLADKVADSIQAKKAATGKPVPAADTGNPVPGGTEPPQESLYRAATGKPVSTGTGTPVPTDTGNPVTRFALSSASSPAHFLPAKEPGGQGREEVGSKPLDEKARWQALIKQPEMPAVMRGAIPTDEERTAVLKLFDDFIAENSGGKYVPTADEFLEGFAEEISKWAELQSPPIEDLIWHRWRRFLETFLPER